VAVVSKLLPLLLVLLTVAAFNPVCAGDFVNWDDDVYVTNNPHVQPGLTIAGLAWALTLEPVQWHPLTWVSLQLDRNLFGAQPCGPHLVNLLLHISNTILLFLILHRLTAASWRSSLVAALFALHPLHVESVAWITERKDVLSTFFWLLTLAAYARYSQRPGVWRYLCVLFPLALGLAAKTTLVTLPVTLLLLDYWPLKRLPLASRCMPGAPESAICDLRFALLEKVPLFILAASAAFLTHENRARQEFVVPLSQLPLADRLGYALINYCRYLSQTFWPLDLACYYPHARTSPAGNAVLAAGLLLAVITAVTVWQIRRKPYLFVGWLWYLVTLLPVIGLVQVGGQDIADHFTYVPLIGIFLMAAWGAGDLAAAWPATRIPILTGLVAVVLACLVLTNLQARVWHDSVSLWRHAAEVTIGDAFTSYFLSRSLVEQGQYPEAVAVCDAWIRHDPYNVRMRLWYAEVLRRAGRSEAAEEQLQEARQVRDRLR
jgi:hypothetical protein